MKTEFNQYNRKINCNYIRSTSAQHCQQGALADQTDEVVKPDPVKSDRQNCQFKSLNGTFRAKEWKKQIHYDSERKSKNCRPDVHWPGINWIIAGGDPDMVTNDTLENVDSSHDEYSQNPPLERKRTSDRGDVILLMLMDNDDTEEDAAKQNRQHIAKPNPELLCRKICVVQRPRLRLKHADKVNQAKSQAKAKSGLDFRKVYSASKNNFSQSALSE